jgi:hypothetical protein
MQIEAKLLHQEGVKHVVSYQEGKESLEMFCQSTHV